MAKEVKQAVAEPEVNTAEWLEQKMAKMKEAQKIFATYTQEQVDKIFFEAAMAANKARIPLAKMAAEETGMGIVEDKVIKNHYAAEYTYNQYKRTKTCGVIEKITHTELRRSQSRLVWLELLFLQQTRHQQQFLKHLLH